MLQLARLSAQRVDERRVRVAERRRTEARAQIDEAIAVDVDEVHAEPALEHERRGRSLPSDLCTLDGGESLRQRARPRAGHFGRDARQVLSGHGADASPRACRGTESAAGGISPAAEVLLAERNDAEVARGAGGVRSRGELALRAFVYLALVVGLSNLLLVESVDRGLLARVRNTIAYLSAAVLSLFRSDVRAADEQVFLGASAVQIVNGCTGFDVGIFIACAILVFPAPWKLRLRGAALGFAIALLVNFVRVLSLSLLNENTPTAFHVVHVYVWPAVISLVCLATLLLWIRSVQTRDA